MRIFFRSKSFYVSVYTLCVCRAVCPVWSGWAWTASVRDLGQTEELRKKKKVGGGILWRSNNGWKRRWCKGGVTADRRRKHTVGQTVRESEWGWRDEPVSTAGGGGGFCSSVCWCCFRRHERLMEMKEAGWSSGSDALWWRHVQTDRYTARRGRYDEREKDACRGRFYKLCLWCILLQRFSSTNSTVKSLDCTGQRWKKDSDVLKGNLHFWRVVS